jgi:hypothetical protein
MPVPVPEEEETAAVLAAGDRDSEGDSEDEHNSLLSQLSPLRSRSSSQMAKPSSNQPVSPVPSTDAAVDLLAAAARDAATESNGVVVGDGVDTSLTPLRQGLVDLGVADESLPKPKETKPNPVMAMEGINTDSDADDDSDASTHDGREEE